MTSNLDSAITNGSPPADVCLLLRAHAEARWLTRKVAPVVRELERERFRPQGDCRAPRAYLEVVWIEACGRAAETDGARVLLETPGSSGEQSLREKARRYHAAVCRQRSSLADRVERLIAYAARDGAAL